MTDANTTLPSLIARLDERARSYRREPNAWTAGAARLCEESATALRDALAREKALRSALEPFAEMYARVDGPVADATNVWPETVLARFFSGDLPLFNVADLRRARAALEQQP